MTKEEKTKQAFEMIEQGVKDVYSSDNFRKYLSCCSKFHSYSLNNTLLILAQKPDATLVAGYTAWQHDHDRHVMKGEKGIRIFAPAPYKIKEERDKIDPVTNKPVLDENNSPVKEVVEVKIPAFKLVSVFDVSQTQGKELPTLGVDELLGDVEDYVHFFDALKRSCPVPVEFEKIASGAKGYVIQYATNSRMIGAKKLYTTSRKVNISAARGKTYYVRVMAYTYDSTKKKVYGKYSPIAYKKISK